jgi:hypothetical protein
MSADIYMLHLDMMMLPNKYNGNNAGLETMCSYQICTSLGALKYMKKLEGCALAAEPGSKLMSASLAKMHRLCLFWLGTDL